MRCGRVNRQRRFFFRGRKSGYRWRNCSGDRGFCWCGVFSRRVLYLSLGVIFVHIADVGAGGTDFWAASNCSAGIGGFRRRFRDSRGSGWECNGDCEIRGNGAAMGWIGGSGSAGDFLRGSGSAACRFRRSGCARGFFSGSGKMRDFFDGWGEDLGDGGRCRRVRGSGSAACLFRRGGSAEGFVRGNGSGRGRF